MNWTIVWFWIINLVLIIMGTVLFTLGLTYEEDCVAQPLFPKWAVVAGGTLVILTISVMLVSSLKCIKLKGIAEKTLLVVCCLCVCGSVPVVLILILIGILVAGTFFALTTIADLRVLNSPTDVEVC